MAAITYDLSSAVNPTETDEAMARDAMVKGYHECPRVPGNWHIRNCDCPEGRIDGCKARVRMIAEAIAIARRM